MARPSGIPARQAQDFSDADAYWNYLMTRVMDNIEDRENQKIMPIGGWDAVCLSGLAPGFDSTGVEGSHAHEATYENQNGSIYRKVRFRFIEYMKGETQVFPAEAWTQSMPDPINVDINPSKREMLIRMHPWAYDESYGSGDVTTTPTFGSTLKVYPRGGRYFYRKVTDYNPYYDDIVLDWVRDPKNRTGSGKDAFDASKGGETLGDKELAEKTHEGSGDLSRDSTNNVKAVPPDKGGWSNKENVTIKGDKVMIFMNELSMRTELPLHVISCWRSPRHQALAVVNRVNGGDNLTDYTSSTRTAYLKAMGLSDPPNDPEGTPRTGDNKLGSDIVDKVEADLKSETIPSSVHTTSGNAIDLRIKHFTSAQETELHRAIGSIEGGMKKGKACSTSGCWFKENSPLHFHIEVEHWEPTDQMWTDWGGEPPVSEAPTEDTGETPADTSETDTGPTGGYP